MNPDHIALITFFCLFGGAMLGLVIQGFLPAHHLKAESKDAVKLGAGLIATMAALVLGILVGSAKGSFDGLNNNITVGGAKYIYLDRLLSAYGPEASGIRTDLRDSMKSIIMHVWPEEHAFPDTVNYDPSELSSGIEHICAELRELPHTTPNQTILQTQALQAATELLQYRWLDLEQQQTTLSPAFIVVILFWLTMLNLTYGIFAPRNATVISVFFVCALSVAGALFIIMEMDRPLDGLIKVPSAPFHKTLEFLGR